MKNNTIMLHEAKKMVNEQQTEQKVYLFQCLIFNRSIT